MWINILSLPIHSHSWGRCHESIISSLNPTISYLLWTINSPSIIVKMASNWHKLAGCTVTCQMMFAPCPIPICMVWNFQKFIQKLNIGFHFVKHLPKSLLALCKAHMAVWYMVHNIVTTKQHLDKNLKVSYTIHKLWSIVVWQNLSKLITNSKFLKIFWNLHL